MIKDKCDRKEPDPIIPLESTAHLHTTFFRLKELVSNRTPCFLKRSSHKFHHRICKKKKKVHRSINRHTTFFRLKEHLVCNREDTLLFSTSASLTKFHLR
jgi:hypothetical protein